MLFLAQLSGGTGSDRHHSAHARPALPPASPASRRPAARWLSARMATFYK
jgi:hypothetical protein